MKVTKQWKIILSLMLFPALFMYIIARIVIDLLTIAALFMYTLAFNDQVAYESFLFNKLLGK